MYFPIDEVTRGRINSDLTADWLELKAFFADDSTTLTSDLANQVEIGAEEDYTGLNDEMECGEEEILSSTVTRIEERQRVLGPTYPFKIDDNGNLLECLLSDSLGQVSYILSLVLSNLNQILNNSHLYPKKGEIRRIRELFQFFATAALAAEIRGCAWSFGFPRLDGSGFLDKLEQIWQILKDGQVGPQTGASESPKDDKVDIFAARLHPDRLPGFPIAVAQVATGKNAWEKVPLKGYLEGFKGRWFDRQPVTNFIPYMIIPFARDDEKFVDDVRTMGNVLHRLRVPRRVAEAEQLLDECKGVTIEGYDQLTEAATWVADYRRRGRVTA